MDAFINDSSWNFPAIKWLDQHMSGHSGFVAGGCFKQIFTGIRVKDVDMFFTNQEEWGKASIYFKNSDNYTPYYENEKVEAYKCKRTELVIELVKASFGSPETIIGNFDFTITKFAYYKHVNENELGEDTTEYRCLYHPRFFEHLILKRLVVDDKIPFPGSTFERMFRYGKYGFFPCRETKIRMIEAIRGMSEKADISRSLYDGLD